MNISPSQQNFVDKGVSASKLTPLTRFPHGSPYTDAMLSRW
jgi:hypothetical protein